MSARILVVDDQPANVRMLEAKLLAEYFDVCTAENGVDAIDLARQEQPDLILLDIMMPGIDGYETCQRLKVDLQTRHIPVIMVTALDQREDRIRGLECGADDFLTKPIDDVTLFARVRSLLRLKAVLDELRYRDQGGALAGIVADPVELDAQPATALVVTSEERSGKRFARAFPDGIDADYELEPASAVKRMQSGIDLMLLDLTCPTFDGLRVCARIRSDTATRQIPIVAIVNPDDVKMAVKALELGANDIVYRPVDASELAARVRTQLRRKRYADKLRNRLDESLNMAITDALTGLHNRRFIESRLRQAVESANAGGAPVSVLLLDIDYFKRINDTHGHEAGDVVLKIFAQRITAQLRALDLASRYGGEEFVILMPGSGLAEAEHAAERIRRSVCSELFKLSDELELPVTVSIGLAQASPGEPMESLLRRADAALYEAKTDGRNRVQAAA
ncbi:PleD family two-component system response regulator [Maricaulis sp.]|uniref:PleD family two-component system response regulator n=1 Tax=Maricaulis sp. TaxID=1486257 RepID=UPI001B02A216|nr:PleD family two-component system response regulator [Maricaulis sp.]MBO6798298.1 PleD family two-component system response regulator [Maricaulis sp.]